MAIQFDLARDLNKLKNQMYHDVDLWLFDESKEVAKQHTEELKKRNRDTIKKYVYDAYTPEDYDRSKRWGSFIEAWRAKTEKTHDGLYTSLLEFDPETMSIAEFDSGFNQHASFDGKDMRGEMAYILYEYGVPAEGMGNHLLVRDAWSKFMDDFEVYLDTGTWPPL